MMAFLTALFKRARGLYAAATRHWEDTLDQEV